MIHRELEQSLRRAVAAVVPDADPDLMRVQPCPDPKFGDYQTSAIMALARARRTNPRLLASQVVAALEVGAWCESPTVAGAGFINFKCLPEALSREVSAAVAAAAPFVEPVAVPETIVVDFSSPNVAKPMHVGHIRSTILGDSLARAFRLLGHRVVTDNHLGDWGTQFGKLIVGWKRLRDEAALRERPLEEMERLYKAVNDLCERDLAVLEEARRELVCLQSGDAGNLAVWQRMIEESRREFDAIYARLDVHFDQTLGESFYNPRLPAVVDELVARGLARESDGAIVVFFEDVPGLREHPAIIRKSDGAANYATTDLATLEYRWQTWQPSEIVYVTDGRQQLHFRQLFETFRRWHPGVPVRLSHVWFGSILGEDGRPFRTRAGETVKLKDLLDEAEERALAVVTEKNRALSEAERRSIARIVGLGAVKYADLLPNRQTDYVFSWDKMLSLQGNTAPYLQYAYTRIRSIFRKGGVDAGPGWEGGPVRLVTPEELALGQHLVNFGLSLEAVAADHRPNYLCNYLYDLAGRFARFFEQCPVLRAPDAERQSRLALCHVTARVLQQGLGVLGIGVSDQM